MRNTFQRSLLLGFLCAPALPAAGAAATDPAAPVPAVTYRSVLETYRPYRDERLEDWRAVNEEVARAGGHVGIMGGAAGHAHGSAAMEPAKKPDAPAAAPVRRAPQPSEHDAHHAPVKP